MGHDMKPMICLSFGYLRGIELVRQEESQEGFKIIWFY